MELAIITTQQVLVLFLLILAGFVCVKTGAIKAEYKKAFSDLLIYLIVPAMIINSYITEFNERILTNLILCFILSIVFIVLGLIITFIVSVKLKDENLPIAKFACIFSNAAYMGFPLIQALFGEEGLIYASAYVTVFNIFLWTIGFGIVSGKTNPKEIIHSICTTPVVISVIIGLIIFIFRIPVSEIIKQPLSYVGNMNTPLSMIITGILIANSSFKKIIKNKLLFFVIGVRMLFIPLVCLFVFYVLNIRGTVANIVLLLEACPSAAITSVFAVQFNYDENLAAGAVVITTFLSIITLPLFAYLITSVL